MPRRTRLAIVVAALVLLGVVAAAGRAGFRGNRKKRRLVGGITRGGRAQLGGEMRLLCGPPRRGGQRRGAPLPRATEASASWPGTSPWGPHGILGGRSTCMPSLPTSAPRDGWRATSSAQRSPPTGAALRCSEPRTVANAGDAAAAV